MSIIGLKFGELEVVSLKENSVSNYKCNCSCGNVVFVSKSNLLSGHNKSCGCLKSKIKPIKNNLVGQKFGKLEVIAFNCYRFTGNKSRRRKRFWDCKCECGHIREYLERSLLTGNTKSCGCYTKELNRESKLNDIVGNKYYRLTVLKYNRHDKNHVYWECRCECGNVGEFRANNLINGTTKSCGCYKKEVITKHGLSGKPGYTAELLKDPERKIKRYTSNRIRKALCSSKNGGKTFDYLPYSVKELKEHLESLWEPWMNWDNYGGNLDDERLTWHIDHVIPHSSFNYASMEDESFKECWSLKNLRPMEKKANLLKSNKMVDFK